MPIRNQRWNPLIARLESLYLEPEDLSSHNNVDIFLHQQVLRQTTLPIVPTRHQTFQRQLSHRLDLPSIQFSICSLERADSSIGLIKVIDRLIDAILNMLEDGYDSGVWGLRRPQFVACWIDRLSQNWFSPVMDVG